MHGHTKHSRWIDLLSSVKSCQQNRVTAYSYLNRLCGEATVKTPHTLPSWMQGRVSIDRMPSLPSHWASRGRPGCRAG
eukprot:750246-Pelagomonas_calceolata.AAC.1